ncbi:hypothetical protein PHYBOEH_008515 [Phytophthora boehmeriae]|uniref:Uncharacterized protein n=1 Tax=Phytophthora boehmeriae TaxID=109152 RepID=A0A8T1X9E3_9STRA|nr:hypothetical protein PHYBOEH_008515 [Phytophthora boehmeriae]
MFGSGSGGGFGGGFASQNGNPFAQSQGPTSAVQNPFQPRAGVKTAFGQSSGFGNQPPLPPGGMTGAPALPTTGFGNQPPLPPGGLGGAPPLPGGGFSGGPDNGNPFGQKKNSKNSRRNSKTGFGANPFGQNGAASSTSTTPGSHTTFGSASGGGPQHKNRAPAFGESASNNAFSGKSTSFVNSTPFSASGAVFGGNDAAFGEAQTGFVQPNANCTFVWRN